MCRKANVHVIVLGGTITMTPQASGGVVPTMDGDQLLREIPRCSDYADVTVETPFLMSSGSMSFGHMSQVALLVRKAISAGADGVVVVQGTDTIDEMAFALHATHTGDEPIIVTGAMRNPSVVGADGPANLLASIIVASSDEARSQGALVVLNDEVHSACYVEKMHTLLCSAFESPSAGPLGEVIEGRFRDLWKLPRRRLELSAAARRSVFADVAVFKLPIGEEGKMMKAMVEADYAGYVVEAMGGGHVPASSAHPLESMAAQKPVVLASRALGGGVLESTYGFAGSEIDLIRRGLIPAGRLSANKARLLLSLVIGGGGNREDVLRDFSAFA